MALDPNLVPDTGLGWTAGIGGFIAIIGTSLLALRKYLSGESVSIAANAAQTELINLLRTQIETERTRADKAEADRDAAFAQMNGLKDQVYDLTQEVKRLRQQIAASAGSVPPP